MNLFLFFAVNFLIFISPASYGEVFSVCPNEAIHCIYHTANHVSKWVHIVMLPKNIKMTLCLKGNTPVYLEKDDVETDGLSKDTALTWRLSQCLHEDCEVHRPLAVDRFWLRSKENRYTSNPPQYKFVLDPQYGDTC